MRACAMAAALIVGSFALAADDKPAIKQIPTKDLKLTITLPEKGKVTEPMIVTSATDLPKVTPFGPAAVEAVAKQIDFEKEKLVVFWWAGSGQDKVAAGELKTADKKTTANFSYTRGLTRDLRSHFHLFIVPKDAEVKVEAAK
jgi:hypothetical protein